MTLEELKKEAKALGYNLIPIKKREKLLPCTCGNNKRDHLCRYVSGIGTKIVLKCQKCGKESEGTSDAEAIKAWNETIRKEKNYERCL